MDFTASAPLTADPQRVFAELADLGSYPEWLGLVHRAEPVAAHDEDPGPAWLVDLGIAIGPFKKTKSVRMVRTEKVIARRARFERMEHDGREHPAWVLTAEVEPRESGGSIFTMELHYGGNLNFPGVEAILGEEVRRSGARLEERLSSTSGA